MAKAQAVPGGEFLARTDILFNHHAIVALAIENVRGGRISVGQTKSEFFLHIYPYQWLTETGSTSDNTVIGEPCIYIGLSFSEAENTPQGYLIKTLSGLMH